MKKIIIITSKGLRHRAFRVFLSSQKGINVLQTISEEGNKKLNEISKKTNIKKLINNPLHQHIVNREQIEKDFFNFYLRNTKDNSKNIYKKNGYSSKKVFLEKAKKLNPDLIVVYGSSIIKGEILKLYKNKILNVHLGLSPYYKGSGTNYFALVNNEPELVGATFMYLDKTIDGGKIIHQIRAKIYKNDKPHQIGNRLILDMFDVYRQLIINHKKIKLKKNHKTKRAKIYKRKDFNLKSLNKLNNNFKKNMIGKYLRKKKIRDNKVPLINQSWIK